MVIYWINFDKMIEIIIDSDNELVCYDTLNYLGDELDDDRIKKLCQIIIDSEDPEINYKVAQMKLSCINIQKHGEAVMKSRNVWYNYLFAVDIPAADNLTFSSYVNGADILGHRKAIRLKSESEDENSLKKVKVKK